MSSANTHHLFPLHTIPILSKHTQFRSGKKKVNFQNSIINHQLILDQVYKMARIGYVVVTVYHYRYEQLCYWNGKDIVQEYMEEFIRG